MEENRGKHPNIGLGKDFMNMAPKVQEKKSKNRYIGLNQIKNLLHRKKKAKRQLLKEKIFACHVPDKG